MQIDAADLPPETSLTCDVAIVGAGPAGVVLAGELSGRGLDVVLLESGGEAFDAQTQALGDVLVRDEHHVDMDLATRRQVGGASNTWGGRCVPFDPPDFEMRPLSGDSSWPVAYEDLEPYFARACEWLRCGRPVFSALQSEPLAGRSLVPGLRDEGVRASDLERWSLPTNFAREYGRRLKQDHRVRLVTGATCTRIACDQDGAVASLELRAMDGPSFKVYAGRYVLAAGGLESTRLLMVSDDVHRGGIGNQGGHLGHWYMAHCECRIGRVHFTTPPDQTIFAHERDLDGVYVRRRFTFTPEAQREHGLPNTALWLANPPIADPTHGSGVLSFVYLTLASPLGRYAVSEGIRQAHIGGPDRASTRDHVRNVLRNLPETAAFAARFGYQRYLRPGRKVPGFFVGSASNTYPLVYHAEHLPQRDSHVRLSDEIDALGVRRLETHLAFGRDEAELAVRGHDLLDAHLRRLGLGRVEFVTDDPAASAHAQFFGGYHQSGTTRMSERAAEGVVGTDLAVHGCSNLFVASSSAFVTSGQANSTFMIVAFALRLADHLSVSR